jgi:two-component system response regulator GlrR
VYCPGPEIHASHLQLESETEQRSFSDGAGGNFQSAKRRVLEKFEREYTVQLLARHGGNITHAAVEAGKERRAFGRMVKKYGIRDGDGNP